MATSLTYLTTTTASATVYALDSIRVGANHSTTSTTTLYPSRGEESTVQVLVQVTEYLRWPCPDDDYTYLLGELRNRISVFAVPNPDISGIGVVVAFLVSAYVVLAWALFAYVRGFSPPRLLKTVDLKCFHVHNRRTNRKWERALRDATLIISDQQIITGVAILLAGFSGIATISMYHWQVITYLAWMSSNVHLTTLTLLREFLVEHPALRGWRLVGMLFLFILLLAALVPSTSLGWRSSIAGAHHGGEYDKYYFVGKPALCYFRVEKDDFNFEAAFSYALLITSYVWKIAQMYDSSSFAFRKWFRGLPEWLLERAALRALQKSRNGGNLGARLLYRCTLLLYLPLVAFYELLESFSASLALLIVGLGWGTLQIMRARTAVPQDLLEQESMLGFGQLLALLLLLQPAAGLVELYYKASKDELERRQAESQNSTPTHAASSLLSMQSMHDHRRHKTFSEALSATHLQTPSERARAQQSPEHIQWLYTSKVFRSIIWMMYAGLVLGVAITFTMSTYYVVDTWITAGGGLVGFVVILAVYLPIASFFSRAFK